MESKLARNSDVIKVRENQIDDVTTPELSHPPLIPTPEERDHKVKKQVAQTRIAYNNTPTAE